MASSHWTVVRQRTRRFDEMKAARLCLVLATVAVTAAISSCDRSPTSPAPQPGVGLLTSVTVSGPSSIEPGESARYTATAHYSHGTSEDVTAAALWDPPAFASASVRFTAPGVAVAAGNGEILARATYKGLIGSMPIIVISSGTFKLSGVISESGGGPLEGVTVEVISGTGQGLRATTDLRGTYKLYGVGQQIRLRASAEGFTPQVREVAVAGSSSIESFALTPVDTPADVSGVWTMTVEPSAACRAGLPQQAQRRDYRAELTQVGTRLQMTITGPTVKVLNPSQNGGSVFGTHVRLGISGDTNYGEWSSPDLYDQLSPTETFGFSGLLEGTFLGGEIRAEMYGDLVYRNAPTFEPTWYCRARDHAVRFLRADPR
jgi:hypothetical protein